LAACVFQKSTQTEEHPLQAAARTSFINISKDTVPSVGYGHGWESVTLAQPVRWNM